MRINTLVRSTAAAALKSRFYISETLEGWISPLMSKSTSAYLKHFSFQTFLLSSCFMYLLKALFTANTLFSAWIPDACMIKLYHTSMSIYLILIALYGYWIMLKIYQITLSFVSVNLEWKLIVYSQFKIFDFCNIPSDQPDLNKL